MGRERAVSAAGGFVETCSRGDEDTLPHAIRHSLGPAQHPLDSRNRLEMPPIEAKDAGAGIGPKRSIHRHEKATHFSGAGQTFGLAH